MHAVAGFVSFGRPPTPDLLHRLSDALSRLPGATVETWTDGVAGLAALAYPSSTPALADDGHGSACVLDGTIANREHLAATLGLARDTPPARLALAAYAKWGSDLAQHLDGAVALIVWDGPRRTLVAVRDRFGVRPLYHARHEPGVLVASTPTALFEVGVPDTPDPVGVAQRITNTFVDASVSVFAAVRRLPPGDILVVENDHLASRPYWRPDVTLPTLADTPDLVDALRDRFDASVRARTPAAGSVGAYLSGGLDSSSIVGTLLAQRPRSPLRTYSAIFPGVEASDEQAYQAAFYANSRVSPVRVETAQESPLATPHLDALGIAGPFSLPTWPMEWGLLQAAQRDGTHVLLSGHGGDHLLNASPEALLADAIARGRWGVARREVRALENDGVAASHAWRSAARELARWHVPARWLRARIPSLAKLLSPELARETQFENRAREQFHLPRSAREAQADLFYHLLTHHGLEMMAALSHGLGIRIEMPYWSADLADLALRLPQTQLRREGRSRPLLRAAMGARLPDVIRTRRSKAFFDPTLNHALRAHAWPEIEAMLDQPGQLEAWIDLDRLRAAADVVRGAPTYHTTALDSQLLLRAHALWAWSLRRARPSRSGV